MHPDPADLDANNTGPTPPPAAPPASPERTAPPEQTAPSEQSAFTYRARHRLSGRAEFNAVYGAKIRKAQGPILVFIKPSTLPEHRLGLSVSRKTGNAVARSRFKRLIREAFRLERARLPRPDQTSGPAAYDIIVALRPHTPLPLASYRTALVELVARAAREHDKRASRARGPGGSHG